jgi:hypothetical protein
LIDFQPASSAAPLPFASGECFGAELVFYPSVVPLRALIVDRKDTDARAAAESSETLHQMLTGYDVVLAQFPWLGAWPFAVNGLHVSETSDGLGLSDVESATTLPIAKSQYDQALPLLGLSPIEAVGLWDGRHVRLLTAETAIGRWSDA